MKKLLCLLFMSAFLAACDDSGTSANESSKEKPITLDIRVESMGMLPNCTETREGEIALVADSYYNTYKCEMGSWIVVRSCTVERLDDLSACTNSSPFVLVKSESAVYGCLADENKNQKWTKMVDVPKDLYESSFTDARDGQVYKTVKIGNQVWMAENLNYVTDSSFCYKDSIEYCSKYGRLYSWNAAMRACPSGWHLPDTTEWRVLLNIAWPDSTVMSPELAESAATAMLSSDSGFRRLSTNGRYVVHNVFGFAMLPAGGTFYGGGSGCSMQSEASCFLRSIYFTGLGSSLAIFWSSTETYIDWTSIRNEDSVEDLSDSIANARGYGTASSLQFISGRVNAFYSSDLSLGKYFLYSVRCLKD
jgi:uncharacterized protein (TIGR02145 family)